MTRSLAAAFVGLSALAAACSSSGAVAPLDPADAETEIGPADAETDASADATTDTSADASTSDAAPDATPSDTGAPPDTGATDSASFDATPEDGGVLACGAETCGIKFQFCRISTSPGICPGPDAGVCPAGCPGCPPLGRSCEVLPGKCWSKPSCACILVETCGSVAAGSCEEHDGGFVAGCHGI